MTPEPAALGTSILPPPGGGTLAQPLPQRHVLLPQARTPPQGWWGRPPKHPLHWPHWQEDQSNWSPLQCLRSHLSLAAATGQSHLAPPHSRCPISSPGSPKSLRLTPWLQGAPFPTPHRGQSCCRGSLGPWPKTGSVQGRDRVFPSQWKGGRWWI